MSIKHLTLAIGGLLLNGTGLSLFGEAVIIKAHPESAWHDWFWIGTLSLILINAGICLVIEAAKRKQ